MSRRGGKRGPVLRECPACRAFSMGGRADCPHCKAALPLAKGRSKYGNEPTEVDGITFQSGREAKEYGRLKLLERRGVISELRLQQPFALVVAGVKVATYRADFTYFEGGVFKVVDAKGYRTALYRLKRRLMKAIHGIDIIEV